MIRYAVGALLVAAVLPSSIESQTMGSYFIARTDGRPLRTWCSSPGMTHCASFFTWHFEWQDDEIPGSHRYSDTTLRVTASITHGTPQTYFDFSIYATVFTTEATDFLMRASPLGYMSNDYIVGGEPAPGFVTRPTTVDDPMWLDWEEGTRCATRAGYADTMPVCVQVPEPSSLLLLATGASALAFVRARRRWFPAA